MIAMIAMHYRLRWGKMLRHLCRIANCSGVIRTIGIPLT